MQNHYHLLAQTPQANLSRCMRHINGIYTQRFNRLHGYDGHLFRANVIRSEFIIRLLFVRDCQYPHFVLLSIDNIEVEALAILLECDRKPLKASRPFQD